MDFLFLRRSPLVSSVKDKHTIDMKVTNDDMSLAGFCMLCCIFGWQATASQLSLVTQELSYVAGIKAACEVCWSVINSGSAAGCQLESDESMSDGGSLSRRCQNLTEEPEFRTLTESDWYEPAQLKHFTDLSGHVKRTRQLMARLHPSHSEESEKLYL